MPPSDVEVNPKDKHVIISQNGLAGDLLLSQPPNIREVIRGQLQDLTDHVIVRLGKLHTMEVAEAAAEAKKAAKQEDVAAATKTAAK